MLEEHQQSQRGKNAGAKPSSSVVADMRTLLLKLKPSCSSQALNALRKAYPSTPLEDRVKAYESYASNIRRVFPHSE